jgi:predicted ATPase/DNA-binding SARP family transcriptional activator
MEFRVLGPVEVRAGAQLLPLGGLKQRALLALLIFGNGNPISGDRLADELWMGSPPAAAAVTLRAYVSRLRAQLGATRLRRAPGGYQLLIDGDDLDARLFERLAAEGHEALARGRPGQAAGVLRQALALWRGPVAADVAGEIALEGRTVRYEELRQQALDDRIEADAQLGRHSELVGELESLVLDHPTRETLWAHLMVCLARVGRVGDAADAYERARTVLAAELGVAPGARLSDLHRALLGSGIAPAPPVPPAHNLPAELTTFIGREQEVAEVEELLFRRRCVTLSGPGGVGKTRVGLEVARHQSGQFRDGVRLIELASIAQPDLLAPAIAEALGATGNLPGAAQDALLLLLGRSEVLLVIDNCEQVAAACAELLTELLIRCEGVRVLATSRERLGIPGEAVVRLSPFADPFDHPRELLAEAPAVRLFRDREPFRRPPEEGDTEAIAAICRGLDGLPLAIELAAARTATLSLAEIAAQLDDCIRLLQQRRPILPERHQTLRAAMDWSYELLPDPVKALFRGLGAFAGGFTLDGAAVVCCGGDRQLCHDHLETLTEASLVTAMEGRRVPRFGLLETIRQYGAFQLDRSGEAAATRRRHAEYFLTLAESANLSAEAEGPQDHAAVATEQDNMRSAIDWAAAAGEVNLAMRLAVALENFWVTRSAFEGAARLAHLLSLGDAVSPLLRARSLRAQGGTVHMTGDAGAARAAYEESLALFRSLGEVRAVGILLHRLGMLAVEDRDPEGARPMLMESLGIFRRVASRRGEAQVIGSLGSMERARGNIQRARVLFARSAAMAEEIGRPWWQATMANSLAEMSLERGALSDAEHHARIALQLGRRLGDRRIILLSLAVLAGTAAESGDAVRARGLWAIVEAEEQRGPVGVWERERQRHLSQLASVLENPTNAAARERAQGMTVEDDLGGLELSTPT